MGKQQNREKVAQEIKTVANLYKKHLVLQADMLSDPEGGAHYADPVSYTHLDRLYWYFEFY